jgi:hypothetical protein
VLTERPPLPGDIELHQRKAFASTVLCRDAFQYKYTINQVNVDIHNAGMELLGFKPGHGTPLYGIRQAEPDDNNNYQ